VYSKLEGFFDFFPIPLIYLGASSVVGMIGNIASNVIAFVAFFSMLDTMLIWFFEMVNFKNFGFGVS